MQAREQLGKKSGDTEYMLRFVIPAIAQCSVLVNRPLDPKNAVITPEKLIQDADQLMFETDLLDALTNEDVDSIFPDDDPRLLSDLHQILSNPSDSAGGLHSENSHLSTQSMSFVDNLSEDEIDALIPDDDPKLLADFAALQVDDSGNLSFVSSWVTAARDYLSPFARGASDYFWAGVNRVGEYASSLRHPEPVTTTTVAPVRRRPRRVVFTTQAPPRVRGKRMSRDEMIAASKQRDSAILSNSLRVYKMVKEKDPASASELASKILQIRKMMENRRY